MLSALTFFSLKDVSKKNPETAFLSSYITGTDSLGKSMFTNYKNLNLKRKDCNENFRFYLDHKEVFIGDWKQYSYLFEVFDSSFLLISYVKGKSFAAGPDLFNRDSIVIIDLKSVIVRKASLPAVYLTRSRDIIDQYYVYMSMSDLNKQKKSYYAITDIDLKNDVIKLYNQAHKVVDFRIY